MCHSGHRSNRSFYWVKKCNFLVGVILIIDYHSPLSLLANPPPPCYPLLPLPLQVLPSLLCPFLLYLPSVEPSLCYLPAFFPSLCPILSYPPSTSPCACPWATFSSKLQLILASVRVSTVPIFLVRSITLGFSLIWILLINVSVKWTKELLWIHLICQIMKI